MAETGHVEGSWSQRRSLRRRGEALDQALRDWTVVINDAFDADDPEGRLWIATPRPLIRWVATPRANGHAGTDAHGRVRIATTTGLYFRIHDFAYRLFSVSDLVTSIGEPGREAGSLSERARDRRWVRKPNEPLCPIRRSASFLVAECALSFVFYHEAAHLFLGHWPEGHKAHSLQERTAFPRRRRVRRKDRESDVAIQKRQLDEIQADRAALAIQLNRWRHDGGVFPGQFVDEALQTEIPMMILLSQVALHIALCERIAPVKAFNGLTHPHPLTRFIDSIRSLNRGGLVTADNPMGFVGDAFRLAAAMLRQEFGEPEFTVMSKDARAQYDAIVAATTSG